MSNNQNVLNSIDDEEEDITYQCRVKDIVRGAIPTVRSARCRASSSAEIFLSLQLPTNLMKAREIMPKIQLMPIDATSVFSC